MRTDDILKQHRIGNLLSKSRENIEEIVWKRSASRQRTSRSPALRRHLDDQIGERDREGDQLIISNGV